MESVVHGGTGVHVHRNVVKTQWHDVDHVTAQQLQMANHLIVKDRDTLYEIESCSTTLYTGSC